MILAASSFLVGLSTIQLRRVLGTHTSEVKRSQTLVTSFLLCFGAGVLLATSMLHILPEIREGMVGAAENLGIEWLAELVVCAGFFLVYLVEELVHLTLHTTPHREQLHKTVSLRKSRKQVDSTCNTAPESSENNCYEGECCEKEVDCHNDMEVESPDSLAVPKKEYKPKDNNGTAGHSHTHLPSGSELSTLRDFLTVLALSFHAVFEGLAVGLEEHTKDIWTLFTGLAGG